MTADNTLTSFWSVRFFFCFSFYLIDFELFELLEFFFAIGHNTANRALSEKNENHVINFLLQGGGGLVQQLRKSYSLSDLTGEKEDENRNTPDARDEADIGGS